MTLDVQTERLTQKKGVDVGFEGLIYTQGVLKTRPGHWHDLFHALVWLRFPKTKAILNKLQYMAQKGRFERGEAQRTPLENALTLFDEGGIVAIKDKGVTSEFIIFGHALLEHVVLQSDATTRKNSPYVSGTTIAIEEENVSNFQMIDKKLAQYFAENFSHLTPKQFYSTPLYSLTEDFGELKQYF